MYIYLYASQRHKYTISFVDSNENPNICLTIKKWFDCICFCWNCIKQFFFLHIIIIALFVDIPVHHTHTQRH